MNSLDLERKHLILYTEKVNPFLPHCFDVVWCFRLFSKQPEEVAVLCIWFVCVWFLNSVIPFKEVEFSHLLTILESVKRRKDTSTYNVLFSTRSCANWNVGFNYIAEIKNTQRISVSGYVLTDSCSKVSIFSDLFRCIWRFLLLFFVTFDNSFRARS